MKDEGYCVGKSTLTQVTTFVPIAQLNSFMCTR